MDPTHSRAEIGGRVVRCALNISMSKSTACPRRFGEQSKRMSTFHLLAKNHLLLQFKFLFVCLPL